MRTKPINPVFVFCLYVIINLKKKIEKWFPTRNKRRNGVILGEKLPLNQKLDCACSRLGIEKKSEWHG